MPFCKAVHLARAALLGLLCLSQGIDCQESPERVLPLRPAPSPTNGTWKPFSVGRDGMTISNHDGSSIVKVQGYVDADGRLFASDLENQRHDVLLFRRVRPLVEATPGNSLSFRFMPDFGEGEAIIQEAFAEWKPLSAAGLRVGKFKTPIGLEVLRSDRDLTFAERSLASDLMPIRDLGAQLEGSFGQQVIAYELGFFGGTADGSNATFEWRGTNDAVARIFSHPFAATTRASLQQLGIGIAASGGHSHGALPTFKTIGQETFFRYACGATADGEHVRASPQAYYYFRSLGFLAEYTISSQTVAAGTDRRYLSNRGWDLSGSFVLTGENNSYHGIRPAHAFEPFAGLRHLGAWEIAFRHSALHVDPDAFPQFAVPAESARQASEFAVGLNWYVNRYIKVMADYEYTSFQMITNSVPRLCPERVVMTRLQFSF